MRYKICNFLLVPYINASSENVVLTIVKRYFFFARRTFFKILISRTTYHGTCYPLNYIFNIFFRGLPILELLIPLLISSKILDNYSVNDFIPALLRKGLSIEVDK